MIHFVLYILHAGIVIYATNVRSVSSWYFRVSSLLSLEITEGSRGRGTLCVDETSHSMTPRADAVTMSLHHARSSAMRRTISIRVTPCGQPLPLERGWEARQRWGALTKTWVEGKAKSSRTMLPRVLAARDIIAHTVNGAPDSMSLAGVEVYNAA